MRFREMYEWSTQPVTLWRQSKPKDVGNVSPLFVSDNDMRGPGKHSRGRSSSGEKFFCLKWRIIVYAIFLSDSGAPKRRGSRGNLPPPLPSPSRWAWWRQQVQHMQYIFLQETHGLRLKRWDVKWLIYDYSNVITKRKIDGYRFCSLRLAWLQC